MTAPERIWADFTLLQGQVTTCYCQDGPYSGGTEYVRADLAAVQPAQVRVKWDGIETAPRGGEWFIARTEHGTTRVVHFADEYDRFPISHDGVAWSTAPIEWTPLRPVLAASNRSPTPRDEVIARLVEAADTALDAFCILEDSAQIAAHELLSNALAAAKAVQTDGQR